ncbi:MAG: hypothetical protein M5U26_19805 [Planctomycetota bacterium]|nr:hypothetical protein [Planctomycetota bacterium]
MARALKLFGESLKDGDKAQVGSVRTIDIDNWVAGLNGAPTTRQRHKVNLGRFFRWATKTYELARNPATDAETVHGAAVGRRAILAFRAPTDIESFLNALKPWPYWQAWCAFAIFCGPRWNEQAHARLDKVFLDDGYLMLSSFKTLGRAEGPERRVPIELTCLAPIIRRHVKARLAEQRKRGASINERSPWLFPSLADPTIAVTKRGKGEPGTWSSHKLWHTWFQRTLSKVRGNRQRAAAWLGKWRRKGANRELKGYWGPDEWRHSFGTLLAMLGWSALEISRTMGNSPQVCERYYIAGTAVGPRDRWRYRFQ